MRTNKIKLEVHRGEGYEFLKGFDSSFKRAQVKLVLRVRNLWQMDERAGLSLAATQLVLKLHDQPEEADAF